MKRKQGYRVLFPQDITKYACKIYVYMIVTIRMLSKQIKACQIKQDAESPPKMYKRITLELYLKGVFHVFL